MQRPISMRQRRLIPLLRMVMACVLTFSMVQNAFADIFNSAVAVGDYQAVVVTSGASTVSIPVSAPVPGIELFKSSTLNDQNGDGFSQPGETIIYHFPVHNTGNVALSNVIVTDPLVTVMGGPLASLAPGVTDLTTFTAIYTITSADMAAGQVLNTASVMASTPNGGSVNDPKSDSTNPPDVTPANDDVTKTVLSKAPIVAVDDTAPNVNGLAGNPSVFKVTDNDTLAGQPVVVIPSSASTVVLPITVLTPVPPELTFNATTGRVSVAPGTPAGTYSFSYRICEKLNPVNCDDADVTVTVVASTVVANDDDFFATPILGNAGGTTSTVYANDTLNGSPFAAGQVTRTLVSNGGLMGLVMNSNGTLTLPPGAAAGTYMASYQICETANPSNCDEATVKLAVTAPIDAVNDDFSATPLSGQAGGSTATVFSNDTSNGVAFLPATVNATITNAGGIAGLVINPDGTLGIPPLTPANAYTVTYRICETPGVTNCDTATVKLVVFPAVDAVNDNFSARPVNGVSGGTTASVLSNDLLNGVPFANGAVVASLIANGGITGLAIDAASGVMNVPAGTPAGPYTSTYQICQASVPSNCDQATVAIVVDSNAILKGTVYHDVNGNGILDGDPLAGAGYVVSLVNNLGVAVATATTLANSQYTMSVVPGNGYTLVFTDPSGNLVGGTPNLTLVPGPQAQDQDQPIDPSGIVYNSVTRVPVAGVTVTLTDSSDTPLPTACLIYAAQQNQVTNATGAYRFDLLPGADSACPLVETEYHIRVVSPPVFGAGFSTTMPPQAGPLEATACTIDPSTGGACQVSPSVAPPAAPAAGIYFDALLLQDGDGNVVNNHIAIDPVVSTTSSFTKKALVIEARRGERVPYVIEAESLSFNQVRIVDTMPPAFDYVAGSAMANGVAVAPVISGRTLTFDSLIPDGSAHIKLELTLVSTAAVTTGMQVNTAELVNPLTGLVVARARATITIVAEHVFDCSDLIGRVFDDRNRNGYPDKGEPGLAGIRLVTVRGFLITTDKNGLFHVTCADIPDNDIGSNYILKLDTRTLPMGYHLTTENPAMVRLTRGKMQKMNFGAASIRQVKLDVTTAAFVEGSTDLKPEWLKAIDQLISVLEQESSTLKITYYARDNGSKLAADRATAVSRLISKKWTSMSGRYRLPIETRVIGAK